MTDRETIFGAAYSLLLNEVPNIVSVVDYWLEIRAGRSMPRRVDFDPMAIRGQLSGVILLDVLNDAPTGVGRFRYRVVGDKEVSNRGHNPTGGLVEDGFYAGTLEQALRDYIRICEVCAPLYAPLKFMNDDGLRVDEYSVLLPFSEDGARVSQILVYSERRVAG